MNITYRFLSAASVFCCATLAAAQRPTVTIDPQQHGALAGAQGSIVQAFDQITEAQHNNDSHLGGHAMRAKELLREANQELQLAASTTDGNNTEQGAPPPLQPSAPAPPSSASSAPPPASTAPAPVQNVSGGWTIYAYNTSQPGSSLKTVKINQNGNILSGDFRGPHQHGHLQGWVNGNQVEFSTDTHDVLTFRGEITANGMSGTYSSNGQQAPWKAERSN